MPRFVQASDESPSFRQAFGSGAGELLTEELGAFACCHMGTRRDPHKLCHAAHPPLDGSDSDSRRGSASPTAEPRRGCCWACYFRARTAREVAESCACCGTRDRRVLGLQTLADGPATLCGNCGRIAGKRRMELHALRAEVFPVGDRRQQGRRAIERRTFTERRQEVDVAKLLNSDLRNQDRRNQHAP